MQNQVWLHSKSVQIAQPLLFRPARDAAGDQSFMTITADFAKGSSGCPVLDERGAVVGIVNNTESIYYDDDGEKKQLDLQMVVKNATPSWAVLPLIDSAARPASDSPTPVGAR